MKTIGLLGGMSWESTVEYYRIINETAREKLGGLHSAKIVLNSVDFAEIEFLQRQGRWDEATTLMISAAQQVERGGGDFLLICTNTMHKMAEAIQKQIQIPILHIADATAQEVKKVGCKKIGLLGTKFTMEDTFYKGRLIDPHQLDVVIPNARDRQIIHRIIYDELCLGKIDPDSKSQYIRIMDDLISQGAQGIILGCTEISLLVQQADSTVPLFDTTRIHAEAAFALAMDVDG